MANSNFNRREWCPSCGAQDRILRYEAPMDVDPIAAYLTREYSKVGHIDLHALAGAWYRLAECRRCGLIWQIEIPNDDLLHTLYEVWIDPATAFARHQETDDFGYHGRHAQELMQLIAYLQRAPADLEVLDYGMGWGKWALMAKAFGCQAKGAELSEARVDYARSNGLEVISPGSLPAGSFDLINTEQVFEHLADPRGTLAELVQALKPGGVLKVSVPTANDIDRRLRRMKWSAERDSRDSLNPVAPLEHINFYRRRTLVSMAESAGLTEVTMPITLQLQFATQWRGLRRIAENLALPLLRGRLRRRNYCLFALGRRR